MQRRTFLKTALASSTLLATNPVEAVNSLQSSKSKLHAQETAIKMIPNLNDVEIWSFEKGGFAPTLTAEQGQELSVIVKNDVDQQMTVHWHGIRVPNTMDGVPYLTQKPILRGNSFHYQFASDDAGTYWYHTHTNSVEQLGRGLLGALIIKEPKEYPVDEDHVIVLNDWLLNKQAKIDEDFDNKHAMSHSGRWGNITTANGKYRPVFFFQPHSRVRLRLINSSTARSFIPSFEGLENVTLIAIDGHPIVPRPYQPLFIAPGMRFDVVVDIPSSQNAFRISDQNKGVFSTDATSKLFYIQPKGSAKRASMMKKIPDALPENPLAKPNLNLAKTHQIQLKGGMMGIGMIEAMRGVFWSINDEFMSKAIDYEKPILSLKKNQSYLFQIENQSNFEHPIHFHGHTFQILSYNNQKLKNPYWSDTIYLKPYEKADIAFVADNPGLWMFHCHILSHQVSGMMGVIEVA